MSDIDKTLAAVAARQHSLITLADIAKAKGHRNLGTRRVKAGRWEQPYEGVYRIAGAPWTWEARVLALVFAGGDGAVASHRCALRLYGLGNRRAAPEITVKRGTEFRSKKYGVHTSTDLELVRPTRRNRIPVTDPARTLLDAARRLGTKELTSVVAEARRKHLVTWHDLIACVAAHARRGRPGIRRMRTLIAAGVDNDGITDTDSELAALGLLREYGFGEPKLQHRIYEDDGERLVAEMDAAYLPEKLNLEIDGPVHLRPEVRLRDERRDQMLRRIYGWTVRRIWWTIPVKEPELFVQIVREAFEEARSKQR
ncbi:MAG TPA: hypothetical protein VHD87_15730 [Acidimicrobiales bacterium]|nr:hypothetical protein [Acidimicrobiales bacterium]